MYNRTGVISPEEWYAFLEYAVNEEPYLSQVIFSVSMFFVFVFSLIGNILTCVVIYYDKSMHTATNYYLFNLAVSDILVTFPILQIIYQVMSRETANVQANYRVLPCKFFHCIHIVFVDMLWNNGILVMIALSIERYVAIYYPMMLKGPPVWRRVGKILAIIWLVAIFESAPIMWTLELIKTDKSVRCFPVHTPTSRVINAVQGVLTFIIPLIIIIFVYTMIAFKVNFNQRRNLKDTVFNYPDKKKKVNKLIVALTVSFVICWLPYFLIRVVPYSAELHQLKHLRRWWATAHKVVLFNGWFSTILNPLLFSIMSTKFRKALKKLWNSRYQKRCVKC